MQEFSFSQSYRFFPSFCQALAEDRVTTPTQKKMFVQILVQVGGDRKWRTSRTTLRTPTPLVIRDCFLVIFNAQQRRKYGKPDA